MSIVVNLRYTGVNGNAAKFAQEMEQSGTADLIRAVGSKRIRLLYDVFHMQQMEGDLTHTLRKHADILGYVHVGDVPDRHEPGTGEVNWDYLKHLIIDELQFDGIWAFELSPATTEEACLQALHAF